MMLKEMYAESLDTDKEERIDYLHYLERDLQNRCDLLIGVGYNKIISEINHICYRPTNRHGYTRLSNIVKIMVRMIRAKVPLNYIKDAVIHGMKAVEDAKAGIINVTLNVIDDADTGDKFFENEIFVDNDPIVMAQPQHNYWGVPITCVGQRGPSLILVE